MNECRRDHQPRRIEVVFRGTDVADLDDLATVDPDVGHARRAAGAIDNQAIADSSFNHVCLACEGLWFQSVEPVLQ